MKTTEKLVAKAIKLSKEDMLLIKLEIFFIMASSMWILVKTAN